MKSFRPLVRLLQRSIRRLLLRRLIRWCAWTMIALAVGNLGFTLLRSPQAFRLALLLATFSSLPVALCWPISERLLMERFRRIDEGTCFEACLEAGPGPVRELLRRLAVGKASLLPLADPPREPLLTGFRGLCLVAVASVLSVETGSIWFLGRPLPFLSGSSPAGGRGVRIEEQGFSEFATEDPAARRSRLARMEGRENGEGVGGAIAPRNSAPAISPGGPLSRDLAAEGEALGGGVKAQGGQRDAGGESAGRTASGSPAGTVAPASAVQPSSAGVQAGGRPAEPSGGEHPGTQTALEHTGRGYEHTGDTRAPSPLLDYRSRLEARYAERTGHHLATGSHLGLGELRDFQRRYFESFELNVEIGATEEPYVALLKRRWAARRGDAK